MSTGSNWTRRTLLLGGAALPILGVRPGLAATPACGDATDRQTEGPYFTPLSPLKADFTGDGPGEPVTLTGRVLSTDCRPLAGAVVDLWHADGAGRYDNDGYRFRGHVRTDAEGRYRIRTVKPGLYPGRTRHYHVKIGVNDREVLTTQLYFPGEPGNAGDWIHDPALQMTMTGQEASGWEGRFDFVVRT